MLYILCRKLPIFDRYANQNELDISLTIFRVHNNSMNPRNTINFKGTTVCEEKVTPKGEHYYKQHAVGRLLGKGGFAFCHEVKIDRDTTKYAIKIIQKEQDLQKRSEALSKVREEINILKSLDNPGIVKYYNDFQDIHNIYIIMELCSGGSLSDVMKKRKTITEAEMRYFLVQMAEIMLYLKSRNIIHRDIKPANYLLDQNFKLKLGDFGLATEHTQSLNIRRRFCGTPNYIAPEIVERKAYGFQIDAWSTGVLMYTMLFGIPPFETKNCKETYEKIKRCDFKFPPDIECSLEAKDFITKLLHLSPTDRLKFEEFKGHPFIYNFNVPHALEPSFPFAAPGKSFTQAYQKAFRCKKAQLSQKGVSSVTPKKSVSKKNSCKQILAPSKPKGRVSYKNVLRSNWAKQSVEKAEPEIKIEENICKQEQQPVAQAIPVPPAPEIDAIKKQQGNIDSPLIAVSVEKCDISLHKKEESEPNQQKKDIEKDKLEQKNQQLLLQQTHKKEKKMVQQKMMILAAIQGLEEQNWIRPKLKLKLKQNRPKNEQKDIKIIHWQHCTKQIGIAYVLSNQQMGILFQDLECMQFSQKDRYSLKQLSIIRYIYSDQNGNWKHREIKVTDVDFLRHNNPNLFSKISNLQYYNRILRINFPYVKQKAENEKTEASMTQLSLHSVPVSVKSVNKGERLFIFTFNNKNYQFYFEDGTYMFFSLVSCSLTYHTKGKAIVHSIPLNEKNLQPSFEEKVKLVCKHYNKVAKMRSGDASQHWLLKQAKSRGTPKKSEP